MCRIQINKNIYIYIYKHIHIHTHTYIYSGAEANAALAVEGARWLRTDGVNTNGAAAKVIMFDRLGKKVRPGTFEHTKVGYNGSTQKVPLSKTHNLQ